MKKVIMNIGYYDELMLRNGYFGKNGKCRLDPAGGNIDREIMYEDDIDELVKLCAENGCDRIQLRITAPLGRYLYRTELPNRMIFDKEDYMNSAAMDGISAVASQREEDARAWEWLLRATERTLEIFDPMEVFRSASRKYGVEYYLWLDLFDDYFPGHMSDFMLNNRHCQWTARDGSTFDCLRSYAFPETGDNFIAYLQEMLRVKPDGIYLCNSNHSQHIPHPVKPDYYGYERPVVERFKELYGVDILQTDDFDREDWHRVKGEFMVDFLKRVGTLTADAAAALSIGVSLGEHNVFRYPYFSPYKNISACYSNQWRVLVEEGIADSLVIGDYQPIWNKCDYWQGVGAPFENSSFPAEKAAEYYADICGGRCELYYFSGWLKDHHFPDRFRIFGDIMQNQPVDGIVVHEAMSVEQADGWSSLACLRP